MVPSVKEERDGSVHAHLHARRIHRERPGKSNWLPARMTRAYLVMASLVLPKPATNALSVCRCKGILEATGHCESLLSTNDWFVVIKTQ